MLHSRKPIYEPRFKKYVFKRRLANGVAILKERLLRVIASSVFKKMLYPGDLFIISRQSKSVDNEDNRIDYFDIDLSSFKFFEVLNIDDFDESVILKNFKKPIAQLGELSSRNVVEKLRQIKSSLDLAQYGGELFSIQFGQGDKRTDLLKYAIVSYIKTPESYFVLTVEVVPSLLFQDIFNSILRSENYEKNTIVFNDLRTLITTGKFISHEQVGGRSGTTVSYSYESLVEDLVYQVKVNITNHLNGHFRRSKHLPCIEHFLIDNIELFKKSKYAFGFLSLGSSFRLDDNKVFIDARNILNEEDFRIRIVKEKGHGKRETSSSDLTDYDWVETHYLIQSLSLPYMLLMIMRNHGLEFNRLKRRIYDFIANYSPNRGWRLIFFRMDNKNYVALKMFLVKSILTFRRIEKEFGNESIRHYVDVDDLKMYKIKDHDLYTYFQESLAKNIEGLNEKLNTVDSIFKPMEDLNVYRTNLLLQRFAIVIGIVALLNVPEVLKIFRTLMMIVWTWCSQGLNAITN